MYGVGLAELQIAWVNFTKLGERTVVDKPDVPVLQRDEIGLARLRMVRCS